MQDRFKVRVWNTLVKKFSYFDKPEMQIGTDGFDNGLIFPLSENSNLYMGKYSEPQFSTGLKDKNGELIYEGDILSDAQHKYIVEWSLNYGYFVRKPWIDQLFTYRIDTGCTRNTTVIGNIYENPELIGGEE